MQIVYEIAGSVSPTYFPAGHTEGFAGRTDGDRPFPHPRQSTWKPHRITWQQTLISPNEHILMCLFGLYTIHSYTSSETHKTFHLMQSSAILFSSCSVNTFPMGLCGLFSMIAFVLALNRLSSSLSSSTQSRDDAESAVVVFWNDLIVENTQMYVPPHIPASTVWIGKRRRQTSPSVRNNRRTVRWWSLRLRHLCDLLNRRTALRKLRT